MLPLLILRCATDGSRRVSLNESPDLLPGGLEEMKLLAAAFLRYSSSTSRLFLLRIKMKAAPAMAAMATIPTTTPAAMAALFGPEDLVSVEGGDTELPAVTTTVWPPTVTTDGGEVLVVDGEVFDVEDVEDEDDSPPAVETNSGATRPLMYTVQYLAPPQLLSPKPAHGTLQNVSSTLSAFDGMVFPHQQSVPFVVAIALYPAGAHRF